MARKNSIVNRPPMREEILMGFHFLFRPLRGYADELKHSAETFATSKLDTQINLFPKLIEKFAKIGENFE